MAALGGNIKLKRRKGTLQALGAPRRGGGILIRGYVRCDPKLAPLLSHRILFRRDAIEEWGATDSWRGTLSSRRPTDGEHRQGPPEKRRNPKAEKGKSAGREKGPRAERRRASLESDGTQKVRGDYFAPPPRTSQEASAPGFGALKRTREGSRPRGGSRALGEGGGKWK